LENANDRQYGSQWARFTSPDPMAGFISDPQTLNRYSYLENSPLTGRDPTGDYKESITADLPVFTSQWDSWLSTGQMGCFMCGTDNSRQYFNSDAQSLFGLDYYLIPGHQGLGSNDAAEEARHEDIIGGKGDPELGLGPTTRTFSISDPAANPDDPKDQQKQKLAIQLGETACHGQSTDAVAGCIGDVYNSPKFTDAGLKGGNFEFNTTGVTVQQNDLEQMVKASGDCSSGLGNSYRCGNWNSIHFVGSTVHLDTANPFNLALAPVHLGFDVIGGNTFWKNGIPRH
jgi:hypothetical protein